MNTDELTTEQQAEADRLEAAILDSCRDEARRMARLLASKPDGELLGDTEFQLRDRLHAIGAKALQDALRERKKGATEVPLIAAHAVPNPPSSNDGSHARS